MNFIKPAKFFIMAALLVSCSYRSPEILPCMCENPDNTLGLAPCMCEPFSSSNKKTEAPKKVEQKKPVVQRQAYATRQRQVYEPDQIVVRRKVSRRVTPISRENVNPQVLNRRYVERNYYIDDVAADVYEQVHHLRDDYASLRLDYVDFRLKNGGEFDETKLGNYRFRIFGCRRMSKNVFLNQGRAMEKDMRFFDIFFKKTNNKYPVVVGRNSPYFSASDKIKTPEYILTAEITDYFMNICDEYDWDKSKNKKLRTGSSEVTITWRLMDLCKTHVYWKGTTTGYGEVNSGEPNGETLLVERAFSDALTQLPAVPGFEKQMLKRVSPRDLMLQQRCADQLEKNADSFQCEYKRELTEMSGDYIEYESPCMTERQVIRKQHPTTIVEEEVVEVPDYSKVPSEGLYMMIDEDSGIEARGNAIEVDGGSSSSSLFIQPQGKQEWVDIPLPDADQKVADNRAAIEDAFVKNKNALCIKSQQPYAKLDAQNLYRVRTAIVNVDNASGKKGAGLLVSDQFILTSADLLNKDNNTFKIKTINGKEMQATAFRVNPNKNVALLLLNEKTEYHPLPLSLDLPEVNKDIYLTLGMLDLSKEAEGHLDNNGTVTGYRYSPERGAEIIVNTDVQSNTLGGALIDKQGNIVGLAHSGKKLEDGPDLFIPIETALKALDLSICDKQFSTAEPWKETIVVKETATAIDNNKSDKAPKVMDTKEVK